MLEKNRIHQERIHWEPEQRDKVSYKEKLSSWPGFLCCSRQCLEGSGQHLQDREGACEPMVYIYPSYLVRQCGACRNLGTIVLLSLF